VGEARRRAVIEHTGVRRVSVGRYLSFVFDDRGVAVPLDARGRFRSHEVALVVDHPNERARAVLSAATESSLAADLG
jgi:hypothetical protein